MAFELDAGFWKTLVPSFGQSNTVVWYAALAIGGLLRHNLQNDSTFDSDGSPLRNNCLYTRSLSWYNKALAAFNHESKRLDSVPLAILSCILFLSIEYQQGNVANASKLLGQGLRVLVYDDRSPGVLQSARAVKDLVFPIYMRQWAHLMNHGLKGPADLDLTMLELRQVNSMEMGRPIDMARAKIFQLLQDTEKVVRDGWYASELDECRAALCDLQRTVLNDLDQWLHDFDSILADSAMASPQNVYMTCTLRMCYNVCKIWVSTCIGREQTPFDAHFLLFEDIVRHGECAIQAIAASSHAKPVYLFDMGIIPSLYFVGWKCRHPIIRRKAVELMNRGLPQEGLFRADRSIKAVRRIIEIEEGDLYKASDTWEEVGLPAEEVRMQHAIIHWEDQNGQKYPLTLIYWLASDPKTAIKDSLVGVNLPSVSPEFISIPRNLRVFSRTGNRRC